MYNKTSLRYILPIEKLDFCKKKMKIIRIIYFLEYSILAWVIELSKANQTRYGVSHVYAKWRIKNFLLLPAYEKELVFHQKTSNYFDQLVSK